MAVGLGFRSLTTADFEFGRVRKPHSAGQRPEGCEGVFFVCKAHPSEEGRMAEERNRSTCNTCRQFVPASRAEREGKVYLVKDCPKCGRTETLISSDAARHFSKRALDPGFDYHECAANCTQCKAHHAPTYAFVDVTNRCNLNCPMCADSVGGHGFVYEPQIEHFEKIFDHLSHFDVMPTVALFGGEPTMRDDLTDIIRLSRSYGFPTRVLTNGLRLADEEYCRKLVESRPHILFSYDGCNAEAYRQWRRGAKVLDQKLKAVENLNKLPKVKVSYVSCLSAGVNDEQVPHILEFCHRQRAILRGLYLMPLVQVWDKAEFDYEPKRMTTEDVEILLQNAFPGETVNFVSLGVASHPRTLMKYMGGSTMVYFGAHPNCESLYIIVSDGEKYRPIEHYLRKPLPEVAGAFLKLEGKLSDREKRWQGNVTGRMLGALGLRGFALKALGLTQGFLLLVANLRISRVFKGNGLMKIAHAVALPFDLMFSGHASKAMRRHLRAQDPVPVVILPLEDTPILETSRLQRCPSAHVYYDPRTEIFDYVPVCSWRLVNKKILGGIAEYYASKGAPAGAARSPREAGAVAGTKSETRAKRSG